jgi:hypothetical protein
MEAVIARSYNMINDRRLFTIIDSDDVPALREFFNALIAEERASEAAKLEYAERKAAGERNEDLHHLFLARGPALQRQHAMGGDNVNYKPFEYAVRFGKVKAAEFLLHEGGLNINAPINWRGQVPLTVAIENNDMKMVQFLLTNHAEISAEDSGPLRELMGTACNSGAGCAVVGGARNGRKRSSRRSRKSKNRSKRSKYSRRH